MNKEKILSRLSLEISNTLYFYKNKITPEEISNQIIIKVVRMLFNETENKELIFKTILACVMNGIDSYKKINDDK